MLKGLDPLLGPDALYALRAMGHGDDLIIADANFPAEAIAAATVYGQPIRLACDTLRAIRAVLSVYPLDTFVPEAVGRMEVVGKPDDILPIHREVIDVLAGTPFQVIGIERFAFYQRARQAFAVIQTLERRPYGCFALRKGVIPPDEVLPNA